MYVMGMTPLLFGDAYLNFGTCGVVLWPFFVGYLLGRLYRSSLSRPHLSPARLVYLVLLATSLQLYRDCLVQAALFRLTAYLPLLIVACGQSVANRLRRVISIEGPKPT